MSSDPGKRQFGPRFGECVYLLDEVQVLDRTALTFPAVSFPSRGPSIDRLDAEVRVRIDGRRFVLRYQLDALDERGQLHSIVGGRRIMAMSFTENFSRYHVDRPPPAGTWIWDRRTICENSGVRATGKFFEDLGDRQRGGRGS